MCSIHPHLPHLHKWHHNPLSCSKVGVLLNFSLSLISHIKSIIKYYQAYLQNIPVSFFHFHFYHVCSSHYHYYWTTSISFQPVSLLLLLFSTPWHILNISARVIFSHYKSDQNILLLKTNLWFLIRLKTKPPKNLNFLTCQQGPVWSELSESSKKNSYCSPVFCMNDFFVLS